MSDYSAIGIPFVLTAESAEELNRAETYKAEKSVYASMPLFVPFENHSLGLSAKGIILLGPPEDRFIRFNGIRYTIVAQIGSGAFGTILKVSDGTGEKCVKLQRCTGDKHLDLVHKTNAVKEAIIHHELNKRGKLAPTLYYVAKFKISGFDNISGFEHMGYLMELATHDLKSVVVKITSAHIADAETKKIMRYLRDIALLLKQVPHFNHGDFHTGNILFMGETPLLADFGYSRIDLPISVATYNENDSSPEVQRVDTSRDLTRLVRALMWYYHEAGSVFNCGNKIVPPAILDQINGQQKVPGRDKNEVWFNKKRNTNTTATPDAVLVLITAGKVCADDGVETAGGGVAAAGGGVAAAGGGGGGGGGGPPVNYDKLWGNAGKAWDTKGEGQGGGYKKLRSNKNATRRARKRITSKSKSRSKTRSKSRSSKKSRKQKRVRFHL
jgi:hypothetical protein